jgi:NitT/TauT family transport system substrate-binding protein
MKMRLCWRASIARALLPFSLLAAPLVQAGDRIVFLTSWFAQAEHGGFYQALAEGTYAKHGLEVTLRMGGPQVNGMQLLLSNKADLIIGYDLQVLKGLEQKLPAVAVAGFFQGDPQGLLTHDDVKGLDGLKDKTILVASSGQTSWWPWLKSKYGLSDAQTRPYTFNLQPFFSDPAVTQQAYASSELFEARKDGGKANFYLFADDGYPPYGNTLITRRDLIEERPDVLRRFVLASAEGWKSYLSDPSAGNALIKRDNPNMSDELLAWGLDTLKRYKLVDGGDAAEAGIGVMTDARWQKTRDFMVESGLLDKDVDWKQGYDLRFVGAAGKVLP